MTLINSIKSGVRFSYHFSTLYLSGRNKNFFMTRCEIYIESTNILAKEILGQGTSLTYSVPNNEAQYAHKTLQAANIIMASRNLLVLSLSMLNSYKNKRFFTDMKSLIYEEITLLALQKIADKLQIEKGFDYLQEKIIEPVIDELISPIFTQSHALVSRNVGKLSRLLIEYESRSLARNSIKIIMGSGSAKLSSLSYYLRNVYYPFSSGSFR